MENCPYLIILREQEVEASAASEVIVTLVAEAEAEAMERLGVRAERPVAAAVVDTEATAATANSVEAVVEAMECPALVEMEGLQEGLQAMVNRVV